MLRLWISLTALSLTLGLTPAATAEIRLLAPASMGALAKPLQAAWPGEEPLKVIIGPTSQLVRQAIQGLDGHILITANPDWMKEAIKAGLVKHGVSRPYISNAVALASKKPGRKIQNLSELPHLLGKDKRLSLCGPGPVPCGEYAQEALRGAGIWDTLQSRIVYAKDATANRYFLESGAVDFAILYWSDITQSDLLEAVSHPLNIDVVYEIAPIGSAQDPRTQSLWHYLNSTEVMTLIRSAGFRPVEIHE